MNKTTLAIVEDRLMRFLIPFLLLGLTAASGLAKTPTVLVLGDSLSAGYGLQRAEAYPALLSAKARPAPTRRRAASTARRSGRAARSASSAERP